MYDMVQGILLSTRDNVNFVNEVFHQVNTSCLVFVSVWWREGIPGLCRPLVVDHCRLFNIATLTLSLSQGFPVAVLRGFSNQEGDQSVQEVDPAGEAELHDGAGQRESDG